MTVAGSKFEHLSIGRIHLTKRIMAKEIIKSGNSHFMTPCLATDILVPIVVVKDQILRLSRTTVFIGV